MLSTSQDMWSVTVSLDACPGSAKHYHDPEFSLLWYYCSSIMA